MNPVSLWLATACGLTDIVRKFGGTLALNCYVIRGGEVRSGDLVELVQHHKCETVRA